MTTNTHKIGSKTMKKENTEFKLANIDNLTILDMDTEEICKYSKVQIAKALSQLAHELHEMENSK